MKLDVNDEFSEKSSEESSDESIQINKKNRFQIDNSDSDSDSETDSDKEEREEKEIKNMKLEKKNIVTTTKIVETVFNTEEKPLLKSEILEEKTKKNRVNNKEKNKNIIYEKDTNKKTIYSEKMDILINGKILINESNIVINDETKYCVVGKNGCGKTTLLKNIYENIINKNLTNIDNLIDVLMIDQDIEIDDEHDNILNFILNANITLNKNYKLMKDLEKKDNLSDEESNLYNNISEYVYNNEWDKYESESKKILFGLGFIDLEKKVSILSGGWRMRLALGKALLRKPQVLILDEPTNHLDLNAVIWLTDYLSSYKKSLIVITHQIYLINTLSDYIWYIGNPELTGTKVYTIRGNYDSLNKTLIRYTKEVTTIYDKFQKRIEEMRKKSVSKKEVDEFIKKNNINRPPLPYSVNIDFDRVEELNKTIYDLIDIKYSYDNENIIFNSLNLRIDSKSRYVLVGENGVGKTTLFKLLSNIIKPCKGDIIHDERVRIGYYHQQIIDNLPLNLTPIEYIQELNSKYDNGECRKILGKLGIKKNDYQDLPNTKISKLSGGQKARVSLASVQIINPHLILMDEPTNHLDIESIEGLIKGLNEFNGAYIIITHDMHLIESLENTTIYQLINKDIKKFKGDFDEYCNFILNYF
jgi:ATP-binding cassette subfamily F protein 1